MSRFAFLLAIALVLGAGLVEPGSAASRAACERPKASARNEYRFETYHVEYEFDKKLYAVGETVTAKVNVTTPAKKDPLGEDIPLPIERPLAEPVEGALVGVGIHLGRVYLPGGAFTDADGNATVAIKLESYAPRNSWADVGIYASKTRFEDPAGCVIIVEYGYASVPRAFRTAP
jgi:hypothetical protein